MLEVQCSQCGTQLRLGDEFAGKRGRCPRCQHVLDLPAAPPQPTPARAAPPVAPEPQPAPAQDAAPAVSEPHGEFALPPSPEAVPRSGRSNRSAKRLPRAVLAAAMVAAVGVVAAVLGAIAMTVFDRPDPEPKPAPGTTVAKPTDHTVPPGPKPHPAGKSSHTAPGSDASAARTTLPDTGPPPLPPASQTRAPTTKAEKSPTGPPPDDHAAAKSQPSSKIAKSESQLPPPKRSSPGGLTGFSVQYDDLQCRRIQHQFGVRIPVAATVIEVDGQRLPVERVSDLAKSPAPFLFLPRGTHAIRWRAGETPVIVQIDEHLADTYRRMRAFFGVGRSVKLGELLNRAARAMDVHGAPFLLNFQGAAYLEKNQWEAAERHFRRSLRTNPMFSPAHLNLAYCLEKRGQNEAAAVELALADAFNVGNVFGLQPAIHQLGTKLQATTSQRQAVPYDASVYISTEPMTEDDRRLVALLTAVSRYAVQDEQRGKILNNLAVHFADSGRPELALEHFRGALGALKYAGPERFELARKVFSHMTTACEKAGYAEAEQYAWMQDAVRP